MVMSMEPGSPGEPTERNQAAPCRRISARWARVSTFCTRAGPGPCLPLPPSRLPLPPSRGGRPVGAATPRSTQCTTALASPAMNVSAAVSTRTGTGSVPAARRSATAWSTISRTLWCTTITTSRAPVSSAAPAAPSSTRCGATASRTLSLSLAGSPSTPLAMTLGTGQAAASARSLTAVGKPAPPRPVRPGALDLGDEIVPPPRVGARRPDPVPGQVPGQGAIGIVARQQS